MMNIAIAGCTGRMGLSLVKAVLAHTQLQLVAGSERKGFDRSAVNNQLASVGANLLSVTDDPVELARQADAVIDFTSPASTVAQAEAIAARGGIHIIGTTGFSAAEQQRLEQCAAGARMVQSGNFSLGINLLLGLVERAARALDEQYDIEVSEMHHRHKKDAPSGTALMLGQAAADGRGVVLEDKKIAGRDGISAERKLGDIGFSVLRGGDVVGEHSVFFAGPGELIELKHQGFSRDIYAQGALHAALWAADQPAGHYTMRQVLVL